MQSLAKMGVPGAENAASWAPNAPRNGPAVVAAAALRDEVAAALQAAGLRRQTTRAPERAELV